MTYNVVGGTLNLAQSISQSFKMRSCSPSVCLPTVRCRQKVCERLIRTKVVQLQSQLKQAAMALIKQMDASYTAKVNEISVARQSVQTDVASTRQMIAAAATNLYVDGMSRDGMRDAISSNLASTLLITQQQQQHF